MQNQQNAGCWNKSLEIQTFEAMVNIVVCLSFSLGLTAGGLIPTVLFLLNILSTLRWKNVDRATEYISIFVYKENPGEWIGKNKNEK